MRRPAAILSALTICLGLADPSAAQTQTQTQTPAPEADQAGAPKNDSAKMAERAVAKHIRPGYAAFARSAAALIPPAEACDAPSLRAAYHAAFDAWVRIDHIAFGPIERQDRRFAILFWPDTKGFTRKALDRLIRGEDPAVADPEAFAKQSIAARGFGALERLLYEDGAKIAFDGDAGPYRCRLALAIARDLDRGAAAISAAWDQPDGVAAALIAPSPDGPYQSDQEVRRTLYQSLDGGLERISALRLGRPLGEPTRARPRRAETWRSGRALRNVREALAGLDAYFQTVFAPDLPADVRAPLVADFKRTRAVAARAPDDLSVIADDLQARLRVEAVQSRVRALQRRLRETAAPALGVTLGFNSLDGD